MELWNHGIMEHGIWGILQLGLYNFVKTQPDPSLTDNSNTNSNSWLTVGLDPIIALDHHHHHHHPPTHHQELVNPLLHYVGGRNFVCEFNLIQLEDVWSKIGS